MRDDRGEDAKVRHAGAAEGALLAFGLFCGELHLHRKGGQEART